MPLCMCGGQRAICRSCFSFSTGWVPEIDLRTQIYPQSHSTDPKL